MTWKMKKNFIQTRSGNMKNLKINRQKRNKMGYIDNMIILITFLKNEKKILMQKMRDEQLIASVEGIHQSLDSILN